MFKLLYLVAIIGLFSCGNKPDAVTHIDEESKNLKVKEESKNSNVKKEDENKEWKEFTNGEISIDYPSEWILDVSKKSKTTFIIFPNRLENEAKFSDNVNLVIQNSNAGLTLDKIAESIDKGNQKSEGYKLTKSNKKTLKGSEILNLEYTATRQGYELKYKQHFIIKNGKVYNLTFTAKRKTYSKRIFKIIRMFNSLDIS